MQSTRSTQTRGRSEFMLWVPFPVEKKFFSHINTLTNHRSGQPNLRPGYHFTCARSVRSKPNPNRVTRRQRLRELLEIIGGLSYNQGIQTLNFTVEGIRSLQEEGRLEGMDDFTLYAGPICAYRSDWVSTSYWAGLMYHAKVAEYGEDNPQGCRVS